MWPLMCVNTKKKEDLFMCVFSCYDVNRRISVAENILHTPFNDNGADAKTIVVSVSLFNGGFDI